MQGSFNIYMTNQGDNYEIVALNCEIEWITSFWAAVRNVILYRSFLENAA